MLLFPRAGLSKAKSEIPWDIFLFLQKVQIVSLQKVKFKLAYI